MAVEVVFYVLAPKPAVNGEKSFAAAANGKVSRGRKWYRLECSPVDMYLFPDGTDDIAVLDWLHRRPMRPLVAAFTLDGVFHTLEIDNVDAVQGAEAARDNAIRQHENGNPGWVVFIANQKVGVE